MYGEEVGTLPVGLSLDESAFELIPNPLRNRRGPSVIDQVQVDNNARLRDELLDGEIFYTLKEAQVLIEA